MSIFCSYISPVLQLDKNTYLARPRARTPLLTGSGQLGWDLSRLRRWRVPYLASEDGWLRGGGAGGEEDWAASWLEVGLHLPQDGQGGGAVVRQHQPGEEQEHLDWQKEGKVLDSSVNCLVCMCGPPCVWLVERPSTCRRRRLGRLGGSLVTLGDLLLPGEVGWLQETYSCLEQKGRRSDREVVIRRSMLTR